MTDTADAAAATGPRRRGAGALDVARSSLLLAAGALPTFAVVDAAWAGLLVLLAAVLPGVLVATAMGLRVARWAAGSLGVLLVLGLSLLAGASGGLPAREVMGDATARLFSSAAPVPADLALIAPLLAAAGVVSVLVALVPSAGRVAAPVGALALYLLPAVLSGGDADRRGVVAALLVLLTLAGWWRPRRSAEQGRRGRLVALLPRVGVALAAVGLVGVVAAAGSSSSGFEARSVVDAPRTTSVQASPLSLIASWNADPDRDLFEVEGPAYPLRLVALTTYDGSAWRGGGRYDAIGEVGDPSLPVGGEQAEVTTRVTVRDLRTAWLPSPGRVEGLKGTDGEVDPETGALLADEDLSDGLSYTVTGRVDVADPATLEEAAVPSDAAVTPYLDLPDVPKALATYATSVTRTATTPYEQALAIEAAVRGGRTVDPKAPSGTSYARLLDFLLGEPKAFGAQVGTSEQFAAAFAVLARRVGLPTRVVVGFSPGEEDGGRLTVRGSDALAWPEVYFERLGWVPFSPTPGAGRLGAGDVDRAPLGAGEEASAAPSPGPGAGAAPSDPATPDAAPAARRDDPVGVSVAVLAAAAAAAVLALTAGGLLGARSARSRRHRRAGAVGAWAEVRDLALLAGRPLDPRLPAVSAAPGLAAAWSAPEVAVLARTAERQAFGPRDDAPDLLDLWPEVRSVRRAARRSSPRLRRLVWAISLRPLLSGGARSAGSPDRPRSRRAAR